MKSILLILLSSVCEAFWNICLAKSKGWTDWSVNILGGLLLLGGIITFKMALTEISLSVTIVIWSGLSLMLTIILDIYLFHTNLDYKLALFMGLGIVSIVGMHYYSTKG